MKTLNEIQLCIIKETWVLKRNHLRSTALEDNTGLTVSVLLVKSVSSVPCVLKHSRIEAMEAFYGFAARSVFLYLAK